tara:strand:- start:458 stop:934 length:477 start_codon:yes stop_codon:yes gene_type:complete
MKRITYWPQLFLGITFNWGIIMGWASINNGISLEILILYSAAIFWTLGYDTIYGAQDVSDDEIIGVKSTAIKFKENMKLFVIINYSLTTIFMCYLFFKNIRIDLSSSFFFLFVASLVYQILKFKIKKPKSCLDAFKINNYSGLFLFLGIYLEGNAYGI